MASSRQFTPESEFSAAKSDSGWPPSEFSRDETVTAVQDFFAFATKMFADETDFESPPDGGWPNITHDSLRNFGKTDEVIDLLRHLPYPAARDPDKRPQLMPAMPFAGFQHDVRMAQGDEAVGLRVLTEGMMYEDIPPHIVGLGVRPVNDHGVLLDTSLGVVWWHEAASQFKSMTPFPVVSLPDSDEDMTPGERNWRPGCDTAWTISDFFATLKHNFKELHFVPMGRRRVVDGWYGETAPDKRFQDAVVMVKGIYRAHGWPDLENYRKEDCLKAIRLALRENFPGQEEDEEDNEASEADV